MQITKIALWTSVVSVVLIIVHLIWPTLGIDGITVALLLLAALPWLLPFLKSLELPGGVKIELRDAKAATEKIIEQRTTTQQITGTARIQLEPVSVQARGTVAPANPIEVLRSVADRDPNLVLVGFRIELEKRLRQIAVANQIEHKNLSLSRLVRELHMREIIPQNMSLGLIELITLGNRAAHGDKVDVAAADWVLEVGPSVLNQLDTL